MRFTPAAFLDTNVLVYAFSEDARAAVAEKLLKEGFETSVQVLNEFANVARRKLGMSWAEIRDALSFVRTLSRSVVPIDLEVHTKGLELAEQHGLAVFDAMLIATALKARSELFYSEDMLGGRTIEGRLRIVNPFS